MASLDSVKEIVGSIIDTFDDVGVTLSIRRPEDYDLVEVVGNLELARNLLVFCQRCLIQVTFTYRISLRICST